MWMSLNITMTPIDEKCIFYHKYTTLSPHLLLFHIISLLYMHACMPKLTWTPLKKQTSCTTQLHKPSLYSTFSSAAICGARNLTRAAKPQYLHYIDPCCPFVIGKTKSASRMTFFISLKTCTTKWTEDMAQH